MTRICVGCICVVVDDDDVNNALEQDVKPCSKEDALFFIFVEEGNEAATPDDETRLGDVLIDAAVASDDAEEYEGNGFNNDADISMEDVEISFDVEEDGTILILFIPPVSSMVIF